MEKHEIDVSNISIIKFYEIFESVSSVDEMNGWEIVVNDGKFYMQRKITL